MGEIAEMMLDGTLCEACGEYIGSDAGYPQYCSEQCAADRGADWDDDSDEAPVAGPPLSDKLRRTLREVRDCTDNPPGMYPGLTFDMSPAQLRKLRKLGLVEWFTPHNPVHKDRAVITRAGRAALERPKVSPLHKVNCTLCGKRVKEVGLADHMRAKHGGTAPPESN